MNYHTVRTFNEIHNFIRDTTRQLVDLTGQVAGLATKSVWETQPVGSVVYLWDNYGVEIPSNADPRYRYVKLTLFDSYNDGIVSNETLSSGGTPTSIALAVVDFPDSPMHNAAIHMINTEKSFLRPDSSGAGVFKLDAVQRIYGGLNETYGSGTNATSGPFQTLSSQDSVNNWGTGTNKPLFEEMVFDSALVARTDTQWDETRPKHVTVTAYLRIF